MCCAGLGEGLGVLVVLGSCGVPISLAKFSITEERLTAVSDRALSSQFPVKNFALEQVETNLWIDFK